MDQFFFSLKDVNGAKTNVKEQIKYKGPFHCHEPMIVLVFATLISTRIPQRELPQKRRRLWCNSYGHKKETRRHEFKSWMRPFIFHIELISLGKVWIQLLGEIVGQTELFNLGIATGFGGRIQTRKTSLKNDLVQKKETTTQNIRTWTYHQRGFLNSRQ